MCSLPLQKELHEWIRKQIKANDKSEKSYQHKNNQYLRCENLHTGELYIPSELSYSPSSATEFIGIVGKIIKVVVFICGLVKPCSSPQELILQNNATQ